MRLKPALVCLMLLAGGMVHAAFYLSSNSHYLTLTEDSTIVSGFLANFHESLHQGNLYPRWMERQLGGAGSPVFVYYSPLAYYISSIVTSLSPASGPDGLAPLALSMGLAMGLSSLTAYFWLRRRAPVNASALIACVLLLIPSQFYSMHMNISLAQLWAAVWFPLGLLCAEHWREREDARFLAGFSLVLFLTLFTHVPSAILFWPTLLLYGLFYRPPRVKILAALCVAFLLALGLAGMYLWPCLANWRLVGMHHYLDFLSDYDALFISPDSLLLFMIPKMLLYAAPVLLMALPALYYVRHDAKHNHLRRSVTIAALIALASIVLFTSSSTPLWEHLLLFHLLQAPFRLLPLLFVLSPILMLGLYLNTTLTRFIAITALALLPGWWMAESEYGQRRDVSQSPVAEHRMQDYFKTQGVAEEYKSIWMPQMTSPGYFRDISAMAEASIVKGAGVVTVQSWRNGAIGLHISATSDVTVNVRQQYFPAWQAKTENIDLHIAPDAQGLMIMPVPAGEHDLTITFTGLAGEKPGFILSLLSGWILLLLWIRGVCTKKSKPPAALPSGTIS